jgi:hypothetical protein
MKLKIKVTKEIIMKSRFCMSPNMTTNCAIALAVRDVFPKAEVSMEYIFTEGISSTLIELPKVAQEFINMFDCLTSEGRKQLYPIEFEVEIPERVIASIDINNLGETLELVNG